MNYSYDRYECEFDSKYEKCRGWLYLPKMIDKKVPVVITAHGLGGVGETRLKDYAIRFTENGCACFFFDYRNFGVSDGNKRQLIDVKMQLEDWNHAIEYIKKDERLDCNNIFLFGSSFSGGHVLNIGSHRTDIRGIISQCPYMGKQASLKKIDFKYQMKKIPYLIADLLSCIFGYHPVMLKIVGSKEENSIMEADQKTIKAFFGNSEFINKAPARTLLELLRYAPEKCISKINIPLFTAICQEDEYIPAEVSQSLFQGFKQIVYKEYPCKHFDIYLPPFIDEIIVEYIEFIKKNCKYEHV